MRYIIDEKGTDTEQSLAMYRVILPWAAAQGDHARFVVRADVYDDRVALARLLALATGEERRCPGRRMRVRYPATPDAAFVAEMLGQGPPDRGTSGELSQVAGVEIYAGDRQVSTLRGLFR